MLESLRNEVAKLRQALPSAVQECSPQLIALLLDSLNEDKPDPPPNVPPTVGATGNLLPLPISCPWSMVTAELHRYVGAPPSKPPAPAKNEEECDEYEYIARLTKDYMDMFGERPMLDEVYLVSCSLCGKTIKGNAYIEHLFNEHEEHARNLPRPASLRRPSISTSPAKPAATPQQPAHPTTTASAPAVPAARSTSNTTPAPTKAPVEPNTSSSKNSSVGTQQVGSKKTISVSLVVGPVGTKPTQGTEVGAVKVEEVSVHETDGEKKAKKKNKVNEKDKEKDKKENEKEQATEKEKENKETKTRKFTQDGERPAKKQKSDAQPTPEELALMRFANPPTPLAINSFGAYPCGHSFGFSHAGVLARGMLVSLLLHQQLHVAAQNGSEKKEAKVVRKKKEDEKTIPAPAPV
eukprot:Colp12_sorted_trinity150504_noHs@3984